MPTARSYGKVKCGFFLYLGDLYFANLVNGDRYTFAYKVVGRKISTIGEPGPYYNEDVEIIQRSEWEDYGLSREMIEEAFPDFDHELE